MNTAPATRMHHTHTVCIGVEKSLDGLGDFKQCGRVTEKARGFELAGPPFKLCYYRRSLPFFNQINNNG